WKPVGILVAAFVGFAYVSARGSLCEICQNAWIFSRTCFRCGKSVCKACQSKSLQTGIAEGRTEFWNCLYCMRSRMSDERVLSLLTRECDRIFFRRRKELKLEVKQKWEQICQSGLQDLPRRNTLTAT